MNKKIFFAISLLVYSCFLNAQVLYNDDFDNYNTGYLGTDYKGQIPGQGGWYAYSWYDTQSHTPFTITTETGKGKVLNITSPLANQDAFWIFKKNLNNLIANRTLGNDVIKFEIDYFTGVQQNLNTAGNNSGIYILYNNDALDNTREELVHFGLYKHNGDFGVSVYEEPGMNIIFWGQKQNVYLPFNTWVRINVYLDYPNRKAYLDMPYLGATFVGDFLKNCTSTNLLKDFPPSTIVLQIAMVQNIGKLYYTVNKYDNIKITALNVVPPEVSNALSANEHLSQQFNLYPNPANKVVNITNNENMLVNQITIYDINGKQISTQTFNNEGGIQLNIEGLPNGTYLLHIETNEAMVVKKLVKK